jgi:hypothetical protein
MAARHRTCYASFLIGRIRVREALAALGPRKLSDKAEIEGGQ